MKFILNVSALSNANLNIFFFHKNYYFLPPFNKKIMFKLFTLKYKLQIVLLCKVDMKAVA